MSRYCELEELRCLNCDGKSRITCTMNCKVKFTLTVFFLFAALVFVYITEPTLQSVGDESIGLFTFCHSPAGAAVSLKAGAHDRPGSSPSFRVQRGVGRGQEAGRVWICRARVVDCAVPSEAVCVGLAWGSVPPPLVSRLCRPLVPGTSGAGTAVGRRQQLPLCRDKMNRL